MKIIGVLGKKRSGKDTLAKHLCKKYGFVRYALADPIKEACKDMFGFNDEQCWGDLKETVDPNWGVTPRLVFQILGTEIAQYDFPKHIQELEKVGRNFWLNRFSIWYRNSFDSKLFNGIVIPDVRFPHEVKYLHNMDATIVKINRDTIKNIDTHASEMEMDSITDYDYLINNNDTIDSLKKGVDDLTKLINVV